jgi:hypothetical protein
MVEEITEEKFHEICLKLLMMAKNGNEEAEIALKGIVMAGAGKASMNIEAMRG